MSKRQYRPNIRDCVLQLGAAGLLIGCGPVMLGEEPAAPSPDASMPGAPDPSHSLPDAEVPRDAGSVAVSVRVKTDACGRCLDLEAVGSGGMPPYEYEWGDGMHGAQRRVCSEGGPILLAVAALDATHTRSAPQTIRVDDPGDASCPVTTPPPTAAAKLCLTNGSFEGSPAPNWGQPNSFDAPPWNACTNPTTTNMPDIVNDSVAANVVNLPKPVDGQTYLALGEDEQASQMLCEPVRGGAELHVQINLSRVNVGGGLPETERVFLEIWGGLAVDCVMRERLWVSPALDVGWKPFCVTLQPVGYIDQITLRTNTDKSQPNQAYLIADNMKPVDRCP